MEKQVGFESRVDIMTPGWPIAMLPDRIFGGNRIPASGELSRELSQTALLKLSSSNGLQRSTLRGTSNYNYGYSTADRPNKLGLLLFSNDEDEYNSRKDGWRNCAWVHDEQRRWTLGCWAFIALLSLLILAAFATVLTWCIIIPRRPYLELLDQAIPVQFSPNSTSSQQDVGGDGRVAAPFSANFTFHLLVKNPNRVAADYSSSRFYVAYRNSVVGEGTLSAFSQKAHATTQQPVGLLIANKDLSQQNAVSLLNGAQVNDTIPLEVNGQLQARLQVLGLSAPPVLIKLWCTVEIKVSQQEVTNQHCHISNHKLIW